MEDFLSKEHYCYKIHTLLMKSSALNQLPFMDYLPSTVFQENLDPPCSTIFEKSQPPIKVGYTIYIYFK